jgi:hypothetical protein
MIRIWRLYGCVLDTELVYPLLRPIAQFNIAQDGKKDLQWEVWGNYLQLNMH